MRLLLLFPVLVACACVSTPGARPDDMSAAGHEAAAAEHERIAATQGAQYRADASVAHKECGPPRFLLGSICWTSMTNPTADYREDMEKHLKMAADHRAASKALREAEARACVNLPESDRAMSPFEHASDIASVKPIYIGVREHRLHGAAITLRAVPGLTTPSLKRLIDCHLARNAALGHDVPEMPSCPLVLKEVDASVSETDKGFEVDVSSWNDNVAREILRRALLLGDHTTKREGTGGDTQP